ncbi:hypothetical protein ACLB2K_072837 [Fragaria x ananassa]
MPSPPTALTPRQSLPQWRHDALSRPPPRRLGWSTNWTSTPHQRRGKGKVKGIESRPIEFVEKVWSYIEEVVMCVLMHNTEDYCQLQSCIRRASHNLITRMKERSVKWMKEIVEMESLTDYTCNPEYVSEWTRLMGQQDSFMNALLTGEHSTIPVEGIGKVAVGDLRQYPPVLSQAFDLKMRLTAYLEIEFLGPNCGGGIEKMLQESPKVSVKRENLVKRIKKLKIAKTLLPISWMALLPNGDQVLEQ